MKIQNVVRKTLRGVESLPEAIASLSIDKLSAFVLGAIALVGVTTDTLPRVVRNQPVAFASTIAICVVVLVFATFLKQPADPAVQGSAWRYAWRPAAIVGGVLVGLPIGYAVFVASWGSTEATAPRLLFEVDDDTSTYTLTASTSGLRSEDRLTVLVNSGTREQLESCGEVQTELAGGTTGEGVDAASLGPAGARDATWTRVARIGPNNDGEATWTDVGDATVDAICVKATTPNRCGWSLLGRCPVLDAGREAFLLIELHKPVQKEEG